MLAIGKRDGFNVLNVDGFAGHVEYGDQEEYVAILGHLDVVPAEMIGPIHHMKQQLLMVKCMDAVLKMTKDQQLLHIMLWKY